MINKERFIEILVECGYAPYHAENLWLTQPHSTHPDSVLQNEDRLKEFAAQTLKNPMFAKFRADA